MSLYQDIYNDFPLRCADVWSSTKGAAKIEGREVTLMLMAATAGFATPWENLKCETDINHPAFHKSSKQAYKRALKAMERALAPVVSKSLLFKGTNFARWYYGHAAEIGELRNMVEQGRSESVLVKDLKTRDALHLVRNALSHNNLFAFGGSSGSEIAQLAFFAEDRVRVANADKSEKIGYSVLAMPVYDMEVILDNWFAMLELVAQKNEAQSKPPGANLRQAMYQAFAGVGDARPAA